MCCPTIVFSSLPSYLESVQIGVINYMIALILGCNFPLLSPKASSVSWGTDPSVGRMDTKVNKGCTVTAQSWYRVEASHQLPAGVQSRLMGSKKANHQPQGVMRKPACVETTLYWIPCTWHP